MTQNPYADTVFESSWQSGFDLGLAAPDDDHPAPSPLDLDQQTAFLEGSLAGQDEGHGNPTGNQEPTNWVAIITELDGTAKKILLHAAYDLTFVKGATVGLSLATGAIMAFAEIAIWGPERPPFFEEAATQALERILAELEAQGKTTTENVELFMAACDQTTHGRSDNDPLRAQGWWHGTVFLDLESALAEAQGHAAHPDRARVLRFQSAAPNGIDIIEL
jgi:hypothetical protein